MPKITRYGHERQGNVKAAPAMLTPEVVGRLIDVIRAPKHTPCPREEEESIHAELRRCGIQSLADVPATIRDNVEPVAMGFDLTSGPDMAVEATYEVTEAGKAALKEIRETASKGHDAPLNGRQGTVSVDEDGFIKSDFYYSIQRPPLVVDEYGDHLVVDNKKSGGEPHVVVVESSRRSGKTLGRDWYVRRNEVLAEAIRFLKARCILVDVVDRTAQIRKYRVSGKRDAMFLEDVVALAESLGFEGAD